MKKTQLPCLQRDRSVQHAANAPYTPGRDLFWRYLYFSSFLSVHLIWKFAVKGLSLCFFQLRHIMMNFEHFLYPLAFIGIRAFFNPFLGPSMPVSEFSGAQNISERDVRGKVCMASSWARSCCTLCLTMNVTSRELFGGSRAFLDIVSKLRTYIEGFFVIHIWVSIGSLGSRLLFFRGLRWQNDIVSILPIEKALTTPTTPPNQVPPGGKYYQQSAGEALVNDKARSKHRNQKRCEQDGEHHPSKKKNTLTWGRNSCQKLWSLQRTPETWCCTCSQLNFSCAEDDWLYLCNEAPLGLRSRFCRHLGIQDSKQRIKLCTQVFRGALTSSKMLVHEWIHFSGSRWKEVHKSSQSFQSDLTMNILPCQLNVDHELQQFHTNFVAEPTKPIRRPDKLQCLAGIHEVWSSRLDTSQHMQNILGEQMPQWFWGRLESPPGTACDEMASKDRLALSAAKSSQGSQNPQHWSFVSLPRKIDAAVDAFHAWKASEKLYTSNIFKFSNVTLWQKKRHETLAQNAKSICTLTCLGFWGCSSCRPWSHHVVNFQSDHSEQRSLLPPRKRHPWRKARNKHCKTHICIQRFRTKHMCLHFLSSTAFRCPAVARNGEHTPAQVTHIFSSISVLLFHSRRHFSWPLTFPNAHHPQHLHARKNATSSTQAAEVCNLGAALAWISMSNM